MLNLNPISANFKNLGIFVNSSSKINFKVNYDFLTNADIFNCSSHSAKSKSLCESYSCVEMVLSCLAAISLYTLFNNNTAHSEQKPNYLVGTPVHAQNRAASVFQYHHL